MTTAHLLNKNKIRLRYVIPSDERRYASVRRDWSIAYANRCVDNASNRHEDSCNLVLNPMKCMNKLPVSAVAFDFYHNQR